MTSLTAFGAVLTDAMTGAKVEPKELARRTGIGVSTVYAYRRGTRTPSEDVVRAITSALKAPLDLRQRLLTSAGFADPDDLPALAADLVSALPPGRERELAVALLRTQVEMARPRRVKGHVVAASTEPAAAPADVFRPEDYAEAAMAMSEETRQRLAEEAERDRLAGIDRPAPEES